MKRQQFYWINLMMFLCLFMGVQGICYGLEVGVAEPVPGFSPTQWVTFNYVTPDAQFMLLQVGLPCRIKAQLGIQTCKNGLHHRIYQQIHQEAFRIGQAVAV